MTFSTAPFFSMYRTITNRRALDSPDHKASLRYLKHLMSTSRKDFQTPRSKRRRRKPHVLPKFSLLTPWKVWKIAKNKQCVTLNRAKFFLRIVWSQFDVCLIALITKHPLHTQKISWTPLENVLRRHEARGWDTNRAFYPHFCFWEHQKCKNQRKSSNVLRWTAPFFFLCIVWTWFEVRYVP